MATTAPVAADFTGTSTESISSSTDHSATVYFSTTQTVIDSGIAASIPLTLWTDVDGDGYTVWIDLQAFDLVAHSWEDGVGAVTELYREALQFPIAPNAVYRFEQYGDPSDGGTFEVVDQINGAPYNETSNADVWHLLDDDVTSVTSLTATSGTLGSTVYQDYYDIGTRTSQAYAIQSGIDGTSASITMEIYCLRPTDNTGTVNHVYGQNVGGEYFSIYTNSGGVFADSASGTNHTISNNPAAISYVWLRVYWPASKITTRTHSEISNSGTNQSVLSFTSGGADEFTASDKLFNELYFDPRSVMPFPDGDVRWDSNPAFYLPGYRERVDLVQTDYTPRLAATADTFTHFSPGRFLGNDWEGLGANGTPVTDLNSDDNGQVGLSAVAGSWTYEDTALTTTAYGSRAIQAVAATPFTAPNVIMPIAPKIDDWRQMSFVTSFDRTSTGSASFYMSDGTSNPYVAAQTFFGHADYDLVFYAGANTADGFAFEGLTFGTSYRVDLAANFPDEMRARLIDPETNLVIEENSYDMSGVYMAGDPDDIIEVIALAFNGAGTTTLVLDYLGSIADNDTVEGVWPRYREAAAALPFVGSADVVPHYIANATAEATFNVNNGSRGTIDDEQTTIYLNNMAAATPGDPVLALTSGGESGQPLEGNDPGYTFSDTEAYSAGVSITMDGVTSASTRSLDWTGTGSAGIFLRCFFYLPAGTPIDLAPTSFWLATPGLDNYTGGLYWRSTNDTWEVAHNAAGAGTDVTAKMPTEEGWYLLEIEKDWTQGGSGDQVVTTTISNPDGTEPIELLQTDLAQGTTNSDVKFLFATAGGSLDDTLFIDGLGWGVETSYPLDTARLRVTAGETAGGVVGTLGAAAAVLPADPDAVSIPTVKVEIAMGQRMVDGPDALTWTDVTDYVRAGNGLNFSRGRLTEGEIATPGQASFVLDNNDARFTPSLTDGPYADGFRARVPVRITQASEDFPLWVGYVTDINWNGEGNDYVVEVQAVDTLGLFARTEMRGGYAERFRALPIEAEALGINAERLGVWSFRDSDTGKLRQAIKAENGRDGWLEPVKTTEADSPRFQAGVVDASLDGSPVLSLVTDNSSGSPNDATNQRHAAYRAILPFPEPTTDLGNQKFGDGRSMVSMLVNLSDVSTLGSSAEARMTLAAWGFEDWRAQDYLTDPQSTHTSGDKTGAVSQGFIGRFCVSGIDEGYYTFSYEPKVPLNYLGGAFYTDGRATGEYRVRVDDIPDGWAHIVLVDASDIDDYDYLANTPAEFFAAQSATLYINGVKIINHAPAERPTGFISNSDISTYYDSPTDLGRFVGRMLPNPNAGVVGRGNTNGGALIMAGATYAREKGNPVGGGAYGPGVYALPFQGLISWVSVWALDTTSIAAIEPLALNLSSVQEEDNFTRRVEALALLSRSGEWLEADQDGTFNVSRQSLDANLFDLLANAATVEGGAILPQASGIVRAVSDQGRIRRVPTLVVSAESEVMQLSGMFSVDDSEDSDSVAVTMKPSDVVVIENEAGVDSPIEQAAVDIYTTENVVARSIAAGLANKPNLPDAPSINVSMAKAFEEGYSGGLLALELGDRVRVVDLPPASGFTELEFTVEAISHTVGKQDWSIVLNLSPAAISDSVIVGDVINNSEVIR